jgi:hypothetical protein
MTGVPLKSEFLFFICVIIVMCHSKAVRGRPQ